LCRCLRSRHRRRKLGVLLLLLLFSRKLVLEVGDVVGGVVGVPFGVFFLELKRLATISRRMAPR
jgi:hypothetical protein